MSEWKDINEFKETTFCFEANEDVNEFFKREKERSDKIRDLLRARIQQLFDEHIQIDSKLDTEESKEAYATIRQVFAAGYQLGWNDQHEIKTT